MTASDGFLNRIDHVVKLDEADGDWIKRGSWDIPADNVGELRAWLASSGTTVEEFKTWPVYTGNVEKLPWLADL